MDFACESERWKQVNLVTNVFGRKNGNACLFDDVTTMASSEFRTCVRHSHEKSSCDASHNTLMTRLQDFHWLAACNVRFNFSTVELVIQ